MLQGAVDCDNGALDAVLRDMSLGDVRREMHMYQTLRTCGVRRNDGRKNRASATAGGRVGKNTFSTNRRALFHDGVAAYTSGAEANDDTTMKLSGTWSKRRRAGGGR